MPRPRSTLIVITGASRGIGRACAVAFARDPRFPNIHLSLLARSQQGLSQTQSMVIKNIEEKRQSNGVKDEATKEKCVSTYIKCMDLSDLTTLEENFKIALNQLEDAAKSNIQGISLSVEQEYVHGQRLYFDRAIFINNAGSTGYVGPSNTLPSPKEMQSYMDLNVTSSLWMSSYFIQYFSKICDCTVVNMSSLCAIQPFRTMGMYCTGKAARDMFHKTMAEELNANESDETIGDGATASTATSSSSTTTVAAKATYTFRTRILNYAPGAIETEMTDTLSSCATLDSNVRHFFQTSKEEKTFIQPHQTAERLVNLIFQDNYENGAHIDYWDLEPKPDPE